jgi:uncharacterized protein YfaS (alpha-2-macroglobulin family)
MTAQPVRLRSVITTLLLLLGMAWIGVTAAAAAKPFPVDQFTYFLGDYDNELARLAPEVTRSEAQIDQDVAAAEQAGNARLAAASLEQLLTRRPQDGALWLQLAQQLAASTPLNDSDGYALPGKLIGAALKAYGLLDEPGQEAAALNLAAQGFAAREFWRPALTAYKESLKLAEDAGIRASYEALRASHGFRVVDYKVNSEIAPPRACFEMSEPLSRTLTDFTAYVTQEPGPVAAVTAEGTRLCVEGLKFGERYRVGLRKGLPAAIDDVTVQDASFEFYVRDRSPAVRFAGNAYVLARTGQTGIPLVSVNSSAASLKLYRIGDRNLVGSVMGSDFRAQLNGYRAEEIARSSGALIWQGSLATASPLNQDVTTAVPVEEAAGRLEPGLYVLTARPSSRQADDYETIATQWFVVSDLGLSTMSGKDGLHVRLRSLATAQPVTAARLRLIARNNEVLAEATPDAEGQVLFEPGLLRGQGGDAPALLVGQSDVDGYGFIDLQQPGFDLTDRGVDGRAAPGPVDAFVYAERGVYRRGETVHASVLLRSDSAVALAGAPLTLRVERPDGVRFLAASLTDQGAGGYSHAFAIPPGAQGGTWRIKALTDPNGDPVGETSFLVEDYLPDRIEFDLVSKLARLSDEALLAIDGRYLFGAPGAGLAIEANVTLAADATPFPEWKGYRFGLMDEQPDPVQVAVGDLPLTDINGHAELALPLPARPVTTRPLKADIAVRLREPGGRAVERNLSLPVAAGQPMIGIRPEFGDGAAPEGQPAGFRVIAVDAEGSLLARTDASFTLKRLERDWQWFNSNGEWRWEAVTRSSRIANGTITLEGDKPGTLSLPVSWGEYRLELTAAGMTPASIDFASGYYTQSSARADTPDTLKVALDRTEARSGETLTVKIESRQPGKAVIDIVGERRLATRTVDVPAGGISVPFTVGEDWGTGAYVLATLYRPMDVAAKRMPARAMGVAWFGIDHAARTLDVRLDPPDLIKPRNRLTVPVRIGNLPAGEEAFITVAAVDVGILNLTRYDPPAPEKFYFGQKRLSAELRDIYGMLIDGMQGERGALRSGGDGGALFNAPPPAQKPLSLYSGIIRVASDGTAAVDFDIPAFNGTIRVMAVAWTKTSLGHASADVLARDPVVVTGSLPRFLAAGDISTLRFDIVNADGPAGDYTLGLSLDGPLSTSPQAKIQTFQLGGAGARASLLVPVTATAPGDVSIVATLKGPGDLLLDQPFTLGVMPANAPLTRRFTLPLAAKGGALTLSRDLLAEMLPGTGAVALSVSPLPQIDAAGLIKELDRYPYGCTEQTVSRALPLLYLSDLGLNPAELDADLASRLQQAIDRLVNRQSGAGAFGLWSTYGDETSLWLTAYVADFMLRAREKGFAVPEDSLITALDYIRNMVGNAPDIAPGGGQDMAYALYVLARAGRAPVGDLKYLADTRINDFGSPLARAQIGAALAMLGDTARADSAFAAADTALANDLATGGPTAWRTDYGSVLRDAAAILALATDARAQPQVIRAAMTAVGRERMRSPYASTQDMAWMVLAARSIAQEAKSIRLQVGKDAQEGALNRVWSEDALGSEVRIENLGPDALTAAVSVSGAPRVPEPAASNGLVIERSYFTPDGTPVDVASIRQNTRLVTVLSVMRTEGDMLTGNFLLVDRLPAGFEIENPSLVASGGLANIAWLSDTTWAPYTEFRDDRFVASFTSSTARLAYMVRAVSPGTYSHPGATVEDMYRPALNARSAPGSVNVTPP